MKTTILLATSTTLASASPVDWHFIVNAVNNNPKSTWKATLPSERDVHRAVDLIGGYIKYKGVLPPYKIFDKLTSPIPEEYDNRLAHPFCPSIRTVRDQCGCGSCFAFGSVEAFEDVGFIICYY